MEKNEVKTKTDEKNKLYIKGNEEKMDLTEGQAQTKKIELEQIAGKNLKKMKKEANEFKKFISRGNVVDMAIGVIIGGAFGKIVTSLVNDIITPLIGVIIGGLDFSNLSWQIKDSKIAYGSFIQTIIDFLIIAICIFTTVRLFEKLKHEEKKEKAEEPPKKSEEVQILEEIRQLKITDNEHEYRIRKLELAQESFYKIY